MFRKIATSITVDQCNLGELKLDECSKSIDRVITSAFEHVSALSPVFSEAEEKSNSLLVVCCSDDLYTSKFRWMVCLTCSIICPMKQV